ncbi:hypothetical protein [Ruegeria jejuensis]|uniref:hypothetical protein n=1 Tax=Ruegeria jejuensis TaxID=3233338 RepID=UPI00355BDEE1
MFEARRLGIQIPCGTVTVSEPQQPQMQQQAIGFFPGNQCYNVYTVCFGASWICYWPSCIQTNVGCSWTLAAQAQPNLSIVPAEALPDLKAQLEAQLKEVDEAERQLKEYQARSAEKEE